MKKKVKQKRISKLNNAFINLMFQYIAKIFMRISMELWLKQIMKMFCVWDFSPPKIWDLSSFPQFSLLYIKRHRTSTSKTEMSPTNKTENFTISLINPFHLWNDENKNHLTAFDIKWETSTTVVKNNA
jgi:hypothetical protein